MFVSALLGLLVTQYVRDMIQISSLYTSYYQTYFHAYGGLELGLAQINYRMDNPDNPSDEWNPFGLEDSITYTDYSECNWCSVTTTINARSNVITDSITKYDNCVDDGSGDTFVPTNEYYSIKSWDGFITPMFYDAGMGFDVPRYFAHSYTDFIWSSIDWGSWVWQVPLLYNRYSDWSGSWETYLIRVNDEAGDNYNVNSEELVWSPTPYDQFDDSDSEYYTYSWTSWFETFSSTPNKNYLVVANASWEDKAFCLQNVTGVEMPLKYMVIESVADGAGGWNVAFGAVKTNELPSYLIYGTINP